METELLNKRKANLKNSKKKWIAKVVNVMNGSRVESNFDSEHHEIANIVHKIELDLMSNLENGLVTPIAVVIKEVHHGREI